MSHIRTEVIRPRPTLTGRTAVVVCAHRMCFPLERCLTDFLQEVDRPENLVFVANGTSDDLIDWARAKFPEITVIELPDNRHYCGGYNAGLRWAMDRDFDFVLLVNADTEVASPGFVRRLAQAAGAWPDAAFLGPMVFFRERDVVQATALRFPSFFRHLWGWPVHRLRGETPQRDGAGPVEFLNGVCVLCRVEALRQIGLLDETMGGYVEDADWSWRAKTAGWRSVQVPEPSIIHHEADHGYEQHSLKTFMLKRNTVYWLRKIGASGDAWGYAGASLVLAILRAGWATIRRRNRSAHWRFCRRLTRSYLGILTGRRPGDWFGPPVGPW
jgi:GT2 family glycosyltransferase